MENERGRPPGPGVAGRRASQDRARGKHCFAAKLLKRMDILVITEAHGTVWMHSVHT